MPHLARKHQLTSSLLYHVYNRGNAKNKIFHSTKDYERFIAILSVYAERSGLHIYHWVLMPNHYHLLLEINEPERLSSIMAGIGRSYVHYHHTIYQSAGHLWQGRFKSQPVDKEKYLFACGRYIERNPVEANMVRYAEDYAHSSAAYYVFGKDDGLTQEHSLFDSFGTRIDQRREEYKEFLRKSDQEDEVLFADLESPQGSEGFVGQLTRKRGLLIPRRSGRPRK